MKMVKRWIYKAKRQLVSLQPQKAKNQGCKIDRHIVAAMSIITDYYYNKNKITFI